MPTGRPDHPARTPAPAPGRFDPPAPGRGPRRATWNRVGQAGCLLAVVGCIAACAGGALALRWRSANTVVATLGAVGLAWFAFRLILRKHRLALARVLRLAPGVGDLARRMGVSPAALRAARPQYREVRIPKRSGGMRVLHVPDAATMDLQRRLLHRVLARLPAHDTAYGFERGRSIAHNAAQHAGRAVVHRFDVVDFFPATKASRIERMFLRLGWNAEAARVLTNLTTHQGIVATMAGTTKKRTVALKQPGRFVSGVSGSPSFGVSRNDSCFTGTRASFPRPQRDAAALFPFAAGAAGAWMRWHFAMCR